LVNDGSTPHQQSGLVDVSGKGSPPTLGSINKVDVSGAVVSTKTDTTPYPSTSAKDDHKPMKEIPDPDPTTAAAASEETSPKLSQEIKDKESKEKEIKDKERKEKEIKDKERKAKEIQDKESKEKDQKDRPAYKAFVLDHASIRSQFSTQHRYNVPALTNDVIYHLGTIECFGLDILDEAKQIIKYFIVDQQKGLCVRSMELQKLIQMERIRGMKLLSLQSEAEEFTDLMKHQNLKKESEVRDKEQLPFYQTKVRALLAMMGMMLQNNYYVYRVTEKLKMTIKKINLRNAVSTEIQWTHEPEYSTSVVFWDTIDQKIDYIPLLGNFCRDVDEYEVPFREAVILACNGLAK
jgi:hypothetical protein